MINLTVTDLYNSMTCFPRPTVASHFLFVVLEGIQMGKWFTSMLISIRTANTSCFGKESWLYPAWTDITWQMTWCLKKISTQPQQWGFYDGAKSPVSPAKLSLTEFKIQFTQFLQICFFIFNHQMELKYRQFSDTRATLKHKWLVSHQFLQNWKILSGNVLCLLFVCLFIYLTDWFNVID